MSQSSVCSVLFGVLGWLLFFSVAADAPQIYACIGYAIFSIIGGMFGLFIDIMNDLI